MRVTRARRHQRPLRRRASQAGARGAVNVEYIVLVAVVGLTTVAALIPLPSAPRSSATTSFRATLR